MLLLFAGGAARCDAARNILPPTRFSLLQCSSPIVSFLFDTGAAPPIDASVPLIGWVDELCRKYNKPPPAGVTMHTISAVLCKYWLHAEFARMPRSDSVLTYISKQSIFLLHRACYYILCQYFVKIIFIYSRIKNDTFVGPRHFCITKLNAYRITCQLHVQGKVCHVASDALIISALASRQAVNILA